MQGTLLKRSPVQCQGAVLECSLQACKSRVIPAAQVQGNQAGNRRVAQPCR